MAGAALQHLFAVINLTFPPTPQKYGSRFLDTWLMFKDFSQVNLHKLAQPVRGGAGTLIWVVEPQHSGWVLHITVNVNNTFGSVWIQERGVGSGGNGAQMERKFEIFLTCRQSGSSSWKKSLLDHQAPSPLREDSPCLAIRTSMDTKQHCWTLDSWPGTF